MIDDNKLLREGIRTMINKQNDIKVVSATGDRIKVHEKILALKPDLLLMDLGLINKNSIELVKSLRKKFPKLKLIVMDILPIQSDINQFVKAGASGFILKDATNEEYMETIRLVTKGEKIFPSQLHSSLFSKIVDSAVTELTDSKLVKSIRMTKDEKKIIKLISSGLSDKEIGEKLYLSAVLVKGHKHNILEKLALSERVQIAVYRDTI
ncbi:MAG: response regulator transcription factor [Ignavibacteriae bacterium]|nr:response regulator transcription factor [Ignavibacteriota bacterium]